MPFADVCYFSDAQWWHWHTAGIPKPVLNLSAEQVREAFASFAGEKCSVYSTGQTVEDPEVHILRNATPGFNGEGLSLDPECLVTGGNSGAAGANIGVLAGPPRIMLLLGIDGGIDHFSGEHPARTSDQLGSIVQSSFAAMAKPLLAAGVKVINCSMRSAVKCFEKMELADALRL